VGARGRVRRRDLLSGRRAQGSARDLPRCRVQRTQAADLRRSGQRLFERQAGRAVVRARSDRRLFEADQGGGLPPFDHAPLFGQLGRSAAPEQARRLGRSVLRKAGRHGPALHRGHLRRAQESRRRARSGDPRQRDHLRHALARGPGAADHPDRQSADRHRPYERRRRWRVRPVRGVAQGGGIGDARDAARRTAGAAQPSRQALADRPPLDRQPDRARSGLRCARLLLLPAGGRGRLGTQLRRVRQALSRQGLLRDRIFVAQTLSQRSRPCACQWLGQLYLGADPAPGGDLPEAWCQRRRGPAAEPAFAGHQRRRGAGRRARTAGPAQAA